MYEIIVAVYKIVIEGTFYKCKIHGSLMVVSIKEGDPKVQFHKDKLINSKLFMVIDIAESLITILKRSLTRLFYSLNLQSVISLKI